MKAEITLTQEDLKRLVIDHLTSVLNSKIEPNEVHIETRSVQNFKSEWEQAEFRARVIKHETL